MSNETLDKLRAEGMTREQLRAEIARIERAKAVAARPQEVPRYEKKQAIYAAELDKRGHES